MTVYLSPALRCFSTVRFLIVGCVAVSIPNFPSDDTNNISDIGRFHPRHLRTSVPDWFIGRKQSLPHAYAQSPPGGLSSQDGLLLFCQRVSIKSHSEHLR
jgi:hypothetical protein